MKCNHKYSGCNHLDTYHARILHKKCTLQGRNASSVTIDFTDSGTLIRKSQKAEIRSWRQSSNCKQNLTDDLFGIATFNPPIYLADSYGENPSGMFKERDSVKAQ